MEAVNEVFVISSANWEYQAPEVIAKELLIAILEKGTIDNRGDKTYAQTVGEMYNTILKTIRNPSE